MSAAPDKNIQLNQDDLIVCDGCICCVSTFYNKVPDCIGCSGKNEFLCISEEYCMKLGASPLLCSGAEEGSCCRIGCIFCACSLKSPTTCCKGQGQCCCYISSCAFPTDAEIPCVIASLCLMCYPACGCCKPLSVAKGSAPAQQPPANQS